METCRGIYVNPETYMPLKRDYPVTVDCDIAQRT
jgi:hypothetical protein